MKTFDAPITFDDARDLIAQKHLLPNDLSSAELRDLDQALKLRSMFSAKMADAGALNLLQKVTAKIAGGPDEADFAERALGRKPLLLSVADAKALLREYHLSRGYVAPAGKEGTIEDLTSDARLQLQVETNVRDAQGYGQYRAMQNPVTLDAFPALELVRMGYAKVPRDWEERWEAARAESSEEGSTSADSGRLVALVNHPIWQALGDGVGGYDDTLGNPWPPFAFRSHMVTNMVSREDAVDLGICGENTRIDPEEDPAGLNDGLQGSIAGYAEFITDALRAFKGLKVSKGVLTFGTANASHSGQFRALRGRLGALREILTANMGTSDGAYKGWETRRGGKP